MRGGWLIPIAWAAVAGIPMLAIGYGSGWDEGVIGTALLGVIAIGVLIRGELVSRYERRERRDESSGAAA